MVPMLLSLLMAPMSVSVVVVVGIMSMSMCSMPPVRMIPMSMMSLVVMISEVFDNCGGEDGSRNGGEPIRSKVLFWVRKLVSRMRDLEGLKPRLGVNVLGRRVLILEVGGAGTVQVVREGRNRLIGFVLRVGIGIRTAEGALGFRIKRGCGCRSLCSEILVNWFWSRSR
jgi:hypothetical protein